MRSRNSGSVFGKWWDVNIVLDETPHVICLWLYGFAKSSDNLYAPCIMKSVYWKEMELHFVGNGVNGIFIFIKGK
jgi:hypothetical protein